MLLRSGSTEVGTSMDLGRGVQFGSNKLCIKSAAGLFIQGPRDFVFAIDV